MKKKICFFIGDISRSGGTERVTSIISNELTSYYDITILSLFEGYESYFSLNKNIKLARLFDKKINGLINFFRVNKRLKKFLLDNEFHSFIDVDTILSLNTIISSKKLDLKTKYISWEHFNFYSNDGKKRRDWARNLAAKYSDYIVTLTEEDKIQYLENLNVETNIDYIYNPTPYPNVIKSECKNKIAIAIGRLTNQKGFDKLLTIWSEIEKKDSEWKLFIIGSGEKRDELFKQINRLEIKRVEIIEHTKSIDEYYKMASLYLMTSRYEGLPMTLIEAQSFGIPIISYNIKTGPKDIILDSRNGYLVENDNQKEFINKFIDLSKNPLKIEIFSKNAYKDSEKFMLDKIIKKWIKVLGSQE